MKYLLKITTYSLFAILFLFSCGDDEVTPVVDTELDGTWTAKSWSADYETTTAGGGLNQSVNSKFTGTTFNYDLVFDNGSFSTDGNYAYSYTITGTGINQDGSQVVDDVNGAGTYTNTNTQLTLKGRLFEYSADGVTNVAQTEEDAVMDYEINADGDLILTYSTTITDTQFGFTTTAVISDRSVWERK